MANRDKRVFHLAECVADIANKNAGSLHQPEDFYELLAMLAPYSDEEWEEEWEEELKELNGTAPKPEENPVLAQLKRLTGATDILGAIEEAVKLLAKPMKSYLNLDSVTYVCPCGASASGEGETLLRFITGHKGHTNGTCIEHVTDDGARCLVAKPAPRVFNL